MTLNEELYFEITLKGVKSDLKKFIDFLKSGELDEFFEFSTDFISYDDRYAITEPDGETSVVLANEDYGIEIDTFDTDDFLEVFCRAAKNLEAVGQFYDIDDEEYSFVSEKGDSYYLNSKNISIFNEDTDKQDEDNDEDEEDDND